MCHFKLLLLLHLSLTTLGDAQVMEYYSKSVAPWCPKSCSCTFYHFARVQGPAPPSYTGEIISHLPPIQVKLYLTSQFQKTLTPKLACW